MEQIITKLNTIKGLIDDKKYEKAIYAAKDLVIDNGWSAVETALTDTKAPWYVRNIVEDQKYAQEFDTWAKLADILCTFSYDAVVEIDKGLPQGKPTTSELFSGDLTMLDATGSESVFNKLSKALDNVYVTAMPSLVTWLKSSRVMSADLQSLIRRDCERHHERDEDSYCLWDFHAEVFSLSKIALAFSLKHYDDNVVQATDKAIEYSYKLANNEVIRHTEKGAAVYNKLYGDIRELSNTDENAALFLAYITTSQSKTLFDRGYVAARHILDSIYYRLLGREF